MRRRIMAPAAVAVQLPSGSPHKLAVRSGGRKASRFHFSEVRPHVPEAAA